MRRMTSRALLLTVALGVTAVAVAEEVTVVTYMPAPTGRFDQMETRDTTGLATEGGNVGIGTSKPNELLDIAVDSQDPSGGACAAGYTAYDENSNGAIDNGECKQSVLTIKQNGNINMRRLLLVRNGNAPLRFRAFSDQGRGVIHFDRARGDMLAPQPVQDGDQLGIIRFRGFNPPPYANPADEDENPGEGDFKYGISARIRAVVDGPVLADDVPGRLTFHTHEAGTGPGTAPERLRIAHNGNVGIGTSGDPKGLLHLERERNTTLRLRSYHDTGKPIMIFDRAKGTRDVPAAVTDGTPLGIIRFRGFNPTTSDSDPEDGLPEADISYGISAAIKAIADGSVLPDDVPGRLTFHTHEAGTGPGGLTERMRIDSGGRVGIGTRAPRGHGMSPGHGSLDVNGLVFIGAGDDDGPISASLPAQIGVAATDLAFFLPTFTNDVTPEDSELRLYIEDNPSDRFSIWGNSCGGGACQDLNFATMGHFFRANGAAYHKSRLDIGTPAASPIGDPTKALYVVGDIYATGSIEAAAPAGVLSDVRLKTAIAPLTGVLEKLDSVQAISYQWNEAAKGVVHDVSRPQLGVIAQDVERVFPELVATRDDGYKGVDYARFSAVLLEAIKELRAENQALRKRIERLEARPNP